MVNLNRAQPVWRREQVGIRDVVGISDGAMAVQSVLRRVPAKLACLNGSRFPLLEAFARLDARAARDLTLVAAMAHLAADERRTAEYLLRNRDRLSAMGGQRLLASARCAAEMDLRRAQRAEVPTEPQALAHTIQDAGTSCHNDPSVGEVVACFAAELHGSSLPDATQQTVIDAVVVFMDLAKRHARYSAGLALIAMRPSARPEARLVTHLRRDGLTHVSSRRMARLLIGPDGTAPDTAMLWWVARGAGVDDVPEATRTSWRHDIRGLICAETTP